MTGIEIDGTKILVLMVAGGVFALFALYLMLRPAGEGAAKIEMFGLKFESSSAAILVFLVGTALLTLPLWVTERPTDGPVAPSPDRDPGSGGPGANAIPLPPGPDTQEAEPNDSIRQAKQLELGQRLEGQAENGGADWFVIPLDLAPTDAVEIKLKMQSGASVHVAYFDAREQAMGNLSTYGPGAVYDTFRAGSNDRVYVQITGYNDAVYEFSATRKDAP